MLFIVATPIGNLKDISERAIETLRSCDLILCEDTRHSGILLRHLGIEKPLLSYHAFNEKKREEKILDDLRSGRSIALISDAGTPLISDPGLKLIQACIEANIAYTAIPGPCSPIQALVMSGFNSSVFQFIGFLPRELSSLRETLRRALFYHGTTIAFESPQRLLTTLKEIDLLDPKRICAVARELTKTYEECLRGTPSVLISHFEAKEPRGEIILLIQEGTLPEEEIDIEELVALIQEAHGLSLKDAIKAAAHFKKLPKSQVYRKIHEKK